MVEAGCCSIQFLTDCLIRLVGDVPMARWSKALNTDIPVYSS